jgi:hypothetical protein
MLEETILKKKSISIMMNFDKCLRNDEMSIKVIAQVF